MGSRAFVVAVLMLLTTSALAAPIPGLKLVRSGNAILVENPRVVYAQQLLKKLGGITPAPHKLRAVFPIIQPNSLDGYAIHETNRVTKQFAAGEFVVRHFSTGTGFFDSYGPESGTSLTDDAWAAVALAPDWIRVEMTSNLALLAPAVQDSLAHLMTGAENPLYLDEIAFMIANIAPEDLSRSEFRAGYITDQVAIIYAADPLLDFVQLKEYGEPGSGDYWTTTVYKYIEGDEEKEFELPRDIYYWYVVHPKLDGEELFDVNPQTGKYAPYPGGLTFREYYLLQPQEPASYTMHYLFLKQKFDKLDAIEYDSLANWNPSSTGYFTDFVVGPLEITHNSLGQVTTFEFRIGRGTVVGTTLDVERAYAVGLSDVLENMLRYGAGNVVCPEKNKHLVVRVPGSDYDGLIETILEQHEVNFEVVAPGFLYDGDLAEVAKIIIPSHQPAEVYQALADNKQKLEDWLKPQWTILEIHGLVTAENDWSGLMMPGDFTADGLVGDGDDTVAVEGQPPLTRIIPGTKYLWDTEKYPGLAGERLFAPDSFALDKWGWWASQNMFDNVSEWMEKHGIPERTNYSVRIAWNHFGNCGECQDILTSVSRTCLTAVANVSNPLEDHVWNEYFFEDAWHSYQISWSDSSTHIDHPGVGSGKKWGGGKNLSAVTMARGDGMSVNRTDYYTNTFTLNMTVVDENEIPMEGAEVIIASESFYEQDGQYPLGIAHWGITDSNGQFVVQLGANEEEPMDNCLDPAAKCNSYFIRVETDYGNFPVEANTVALVVGPMEAVPGEEFAITVPIEGTRTPHRPLGAMEFDSGDETAVLRLSIDSAVEMACGYSLYGMTYCDHVGDGAMDVYLLDQANLSAFAQGEPFSALAFQEMAGPGFELLVHPPYAGDWYAVLSHQGRYHHEMLIDAQFEVHRFLEPALPDGGDDDLGSVRADEGPAQEDVIAPPQELVAGFDTSPPADSGTDDHGCRAGPASRMPAGLGLLAMMLALCLVLLRRPGEPSK